MRYVLIRWWPLIFTFAITAGAGAVLLYG